jgi:hypothetical protein
MRGILPYEKHTFTPTNSYSCWEILTPYYKLALTYTQTALDDDEILPETRNNIVLSRRILALGLDGHAVRPLVSTSSSDGERP